jgi:hypothetical protein
MNRRDALRYFTAAAVLPMLSELEHDQFSFVRQLHKLTDGLHSGDSLQVLTPHQNLTVIAATERIIPQTDTPGASAAGVNRFIDTMLAGWYPPTDRERFLAGLAELDDRAHRMHGKVFVDCTAAEQTMLLGLLSDEAAASQRPGLPSAATDPPRPNEARFTAINKHWFSMLKDLTIWGYYTSEMGQVEELKVLSVSSNYDGCAPRLPRNLRGTIDPT